MSLKERLSDFAGSVVAAASRAPDEYPEWEHWTYETHMADIRTLWAEIRPQLKRDVDQASLVDESLQQMFRSFDAGDKETGRKTALTIYNLVEKLR